MVFVRIKKIKNHTYLYLVENTWDSKRSCAKQKVIKYYGRVELGKVITQVVIDRDKCCKSCGNKENLTVDHIIPLSLGGKNDYDNVWTLCQDCNLKKGRKIYIDGVLIEPSYKQRLYCQLQLLIKAYSNEYKKDNLNWTEDELHRSVMRRKKVIELVEKTKNLI